MVEFTYHFNLPWDTHGTTPANCPQVPTIEARTTAKGEKRYRVKVRLLGQAPRTRTFKRLTDAKAWAAAAETDLSRGDHVPTTAQRRTTLADLKSFCLAMVQADQLGIPIGRVLRVQSHEMRIKRRQRAEEKAQKVPVKIMVPLVLFILPCLFIVVIGPGALKIIGIFSS